MPKTSKELLDEAIAAQKAGTYVDPLIGAKASLRQAQPLQALLNEVNRQNLEPQHQAAQDRAGNAPREFLRGVRESPVAEAALMAGSVIPSPAQPVFAGLSALEAGADFAEAPGLGSGINAALAALPGAQQIRSAMKLAKTTREGKQVAEGMFRMGGASRGAEKTYRLPRDMGGDTPASVQGLLNKPTGTFRAADELAHPGAQRYMDREFKANNPIFRKMQMEGQFGERGFNEAIENTSREMPSMVALDDVAAAQVKPGMGEVDELVAGLRGPRAARSTPDADFVHPQDTTGGAFGFEELPEISEGELVRLQALFKRLGL